MSWTDANELSWGLSQIDKFTRHGLLVAMDWERSKQSTDALRAKVRLEWIKGGIAVADLWNARNCEAMETRK
jgi:hypothetical protein